MKCRIYAISDLHLSLYNGKTMDKFGENWINHHIKIKENCMQIVEPEDFILICGDISWAMKINEAISDLEFIHSLPGTKIMVKGNHDYWWDKTSKLSGLYDDMIFLGKGHFSLGDSAICGTRGWIAPNDSFFEVQDNKIYKRELQRLEASLESAIRDNTKKIIVMIHFPVFSDKHEPTGFIDIMQKYPVEKVIYGHLHGDNIQHKVNGEYNGIEYRLTSADFLEFKPFLIDEIPRK